MVLLGVVEDLKLSELLDEFVHDIKNPGAFGITIMLLGGLFFILLIIGSFQNKKSHFKKGEKKSLINKKGNAGNLTPPVAAQGSDKDAVTGVLVQYVFDENTYTKGGSCIQNNTNTKSLDKSKRKQVFRVIQDTLRMYPKSLIQKRLSSVYIFDDLEFKGAKYGGTAENDRLYLKYSDYYRFFRTEKVFHHEFGHILEDSYAHLFDKDKWTNLNLIPYKYDHGFKALLAKYTGKRNNRLNSKGFIDEYGHSCFEEDFCSFVELLFQPLHETDDFINQYPILQSKMTLLKEFYHKIDPSFFTSKYFDSIRSAKDKSIEFEKKGDYNNALIHMVSYSSLIHSNYGNNQIKKHYPKIRELGKLASNHEDFPAWVKKIIK